MRKLLFLLLLGALVSVQLYAQKPPVSDYDRYLMEEDEEDDIRDAVYHIYVGTFPNADLWELNKLSNSSKVLTKQLSDSTLVFLGPYKQETVAIKEWSGVIIDGFKDARIYRNEQNITPTAKGQIFSYKEALAAGELAGLKPEKLSQIAAPKPAVVQAPPPPPSKAEETVAITTPPPAQEEPILPPTPVFTPPPAKTLTPATPASSPPIVTQTPPPVSQPPVVFIPPPIQSEPQKQTPPPPTQPSVVTANPTLPPAQPAYTPSKPVTAPPQPAALQPVAIQEPPVSQPPVVFTPPPIQSEPQKQTPPPPTQPSVVATPTLPPAQPAYTPSKPVTAPPQPAALQPVAIQEQPAIYTPNTPTAIQPPVATLPPTTQQTQKQPANNPYNQPPATLPQTPTTTPEPQTITLTPSYNNNNTPKVVKPIIAKPSAIQPVPYPGSSVITYIPPTTGQLDPMYSNPQLDELKKENDLLAYNNRSGEIITAPESGVTRALTPRKMVVPEYTCETRQLQFLQVVALPDLTLAHRYEQLSADYNVLLFEDEKDKLFKLLIGPFETVGDAESAKRYINKQFGKQYHDAFVRPMCYDVGQLNADLTQNGFSYMQLPILFNQK